MDTPYVRSRPTGQPWRAVAAPETDGSVRIAGLLTSHNRRELTVEAVRRLYSQCPPSVDLDVLVLDAGSSDGTPEALEAAFDGIKVLRHDASVFWNGGMRRVFRHAVDHGYDFYLWLNDDTFLDDDAVSRLLATHRDVAATAPWAPAMVAGAVRDPDTGTLTYGGVRRAGPITPLRFELVVEASTPTPVDTINGNVVLVSDDVVERIGLLDATFTHAMGDFDYGLRARAAGCGVWVAPGTVGMCRRNAPRGRSTLGEQARALLGPKGLPPREWTTFARRWGGPAWPVYAVSPYVRRLGAAATHTAAQLLRR